MIKMSSLVIISETFFLSSSSSNIRLSFMSLSLALHTLESLFKSQINIFYFIEWYFIVFRRLHESRNSKVKGHSHRQTQNTKFYLWLEVHTWYYSFGAVTLLLQKLFIVVKDAVGHVFIIGVLLHRPPILVVIMRVNTLKRVPHFRKYFLTLI